MRRFALFTLPLLLVFFTGCADQGTAPELDISASYAKPDKPAKPPPDPDQTEEAKPVIAYESGDALWVMDEDGGNRTKIFEAGAYFIPSWSSLGDGITIPYEVLITGTSTGRLPVVKAEVYLDGGVPRVGEVETLSTELDYVQARISPNGEDFVAVHSAPPEHQGSLVISGMEAFSPQTAYLIPGHGPYQPAWNPEGTKLAFFDMEEATGIVTLKIMDASTFSVSTAFTIPWESWPPRGLSWSPATNRNELAFDCDFSLATVVLDETLPMVDPPIQYLGPGIAPIWSPDGTKIIYTNNNRIYVKTVGSSKRDVRLTNGMRPDWRQ